MANFLNTDGLSALWAKIKSKFYTKTEVDALIPEDEVMIVNISWDNANQKYVADKTAQEIAAFVNNDGVAVVNSNDSNSMLLCNTVISDVTENYYYAGFYYAAIEDVEGGTLAYGGRITIKHENGIESVEIAQGNNSIPLPAGNSDGLPIMDGTASRGDSINYARADHVHPSDTSKANVADVLSKTNTTSYMPSANYHPATKKYVDDSISSLSSDLFIVNFTQNDTTYTSDKTYSEIMSAIANGKTVVGKTTVSSNHNWYTLVRDISSSSPKLSFSYSCLAEVSGRLIAYIYQIIIDDTNTITTQNWTNYTSTYNSQIYAGRTSIAKSNHNGTSWPANTATNAYNVGDLVWFRQDKLIKITANVSAGGTLTENTNYVTTTIADEIANTTTDLAGLTDTTISSPSNGQVLSYDSASSKWINTTLSSDAFIVTITSGVSEGVTWYQKNKSFNEIVAAYDAGKKCYLTHGIYLYYLTLKNNNKVVFLQVHQDDVTGNVVKSFTIDSNNDIAYKATHIYENISELNDVTILSNSLTTGQALIYGGAKVGWKNADIATDLVSLTDTTITSPANGQVLSYDSTTSKWINTNALTETRVNELIAAVLAQYGDGDIASYGYTDASEVNY